MIAGNNLRDFEIGVGDKLPSVGEDVSSDDYTVCATQSGAVPDGAVVEYECSPQPLLGQIVTVHIPQSTACLSLCNVEVYAGRNILYKTV